MAIKGHVDRWSDNEISGWLWDPGSPEKQVDFRLVSRGVELANGRADLPREDLRQAGIGEGRHAFHLKLHPFAGFYPKEGACFCFGGHSMDVSDFTSEASEIVGGQHAAADRTTLYYYPDYSPTNYYQVGLYGEAPPSARVRAGSIHEALEYLTTAAEVERVAFHLHWTTPVLAPSLHEGDALARKEGFTSALRAFVRMGGVFYWTIHNLYPHDAKHTAVERDLCRELASIATKILVHNQTSVGLVAKAYGVDASKIHLLPHGNYEPVIEAEDRELSRQRIRRQYGIGDDDFVFTFMGQLRPYKGIDDLLESFAELRKRTPGRKIWLLVAGKPVHPVPPGRYARLARVLPQVIVNEGFLDGDDFNDHLFAADVVVCPYRNILTSGSILHALSAGLPVVAPDIPQVAELVASGTNGQLFGRDVSLTEAMHRAMAGVDGDLLEAATCRESVDRFRWPEISRAFFRIVEGDEAFTWSDDGHHSLRVRAAAKASDTVCIVVNYEHLEDVSRLVASLHDLEDPPDVIVVDSGSPGLHERAFLQLSPRVAVVRVGRNVGYAASVNIGVRHARQNGYEYVCVINPDMVAFPGSIRALREHVRGEAVLASGMIYNDLDQKSIWYSGGRVQLKGMVRIGHDRDEFTGGRQTEYLSGACIFGALSTFEKVGEWPEDYFLYFEETDWCQRARSVGIRLEVVAASRFAHLKRSTLGGLPQPYYLYYYIRNALVFGARHSKVPATSRLHHLQASFIDPWIERLEKRHPRISAAARHLVARAVEDGLAGRSGQVDGVAWDGLQLVEQARGHLELVRNGTVRGWVAGHRECMLRMLWDGRSRGVFVASSEAADLPILQDGMARRFVVPLPATAGMLEAQRWPGGETLFGGIAEIEPAENDFAARVDGVALGRLSGWAGERNNGQTTQVDVFIDDVPYASVTGTKFRKDLRHAAIRDGFAGFSVLLDKEVLSRREIKVALRLPGSPEKLDEREIRLPARAVGLAELGSTADFLRWSIRHGEATAEMEGFYALREGMLADVSAAVVRRAEAASPAGKITVVMPAYNREATIARSLESVLAQTHDDWELLLVDDGSTDATLTVVHGILEGLAASVKPRVTVIALEDNRGVSAARNEGLARATGDYVAYLDSDNTWHPSYLKTMLHALERSGRRSAYCGQDIYYCDGERDLLYAARLHPFCISALESRNFVDLNAFFHAREHTGSQLRFNTSMQRLVDWEFIVRLVRSCPPAVVPAFLSRYDFNKAANQITATVDFTQNVKALRGTVGVSEGPATGAPGFELDVANCVEGPDAALLLEQFSGAMAGGGIHAIHPDEGPRPGVPTLVMFRGARIPPGSLQQMRGRLDESNAAIVTGRLLADSGVARKSGLASFAGVLECDLNLFALAAAFDDVSVRETAGTLRATRSAGIGYALLAPGIWEDVHRKAGEWQCTPQQALDRISAAYSNCGEPAVLFDPAAVAYDAQA